MHSKILRIIAIVLVVLLQAWVFNYITLFRVATPYIYLFGLMLLPIKESKVSCTLIGAAIGACVDLLSGTAGVHMAATTLAGFLRPYLLQPLTEPTNNTALAPSGKELKKGIYLILLLWVTIHHAVLFFLDGFFGFHMGYLLVRLAGSIVLSYLILLLLQVFFLDLSPKDD